jgi:peroxiredoxin Q/BCP
MITSGTKIPNFKALLQNDQEISNQLLLGKKYIIYFYPKDDTPGCTAEACSLRDDYEAIKALGYEVYGVSMDSASKHKKFIEKYQLPFNLVVDTNAELIKAFGAWGKKKFMGKEYEGILRSTFIINDKGVVTAVIDDVKTKNHASQILEIIQ